MMLRLLTIPGKSDAPSSTLHIKLRDLKKFSTPSPNSYNPRSAEKETRKAAASYSFGMKTEPGLGTSSKACPAPNAYAVPPIKDSPAYSLAPRAKEQKVALLPGPGSYEVVQAYWLASHKYLCCCSPAMSTF